MTRSLETADSAPVRVLAAGSSWLRTAAASLEGDGFVVLERPAAPKARSAEGADAVDDEASEVDCVFTDDPAVAAAANGDRPVVFGVGESTPDATADALEAGAVEVVTRADCECPDLLGNRLRRSVDGSTARRPTADREAWYRSLLERSPSILTVLDERGRRTYASPAAARVAGCDPDDLVGEPVTDIVHPDDREAVRNALERALDGGPGATATCEYRTRLDDDRRVHELEFTNRLDDPVVGGLIGSVRDVTAYRRVERELDESFERVTDAFLTLDAEWRFSYVNERAAEILGRAETDLLGRELFELFPEATDTPLHAAAVEAVDRQEPRTVDAYYEPCDAWIEARIYPSRIGVSVYFRDVTDRVERERAFAERTERLETLVDHVPTVLFAFDTEGTIVLSEGLGLRQIGLETDDLVDRSVFDAFEDHPKLVADARRALEGEPVHATHHYAGRVFETWYRPITKDGALERVTGVAVDVTDRIQYEQTMNALHEATRHLLSVESKQTACEYIVDVSNDVLGLKGVVLYRFDEQQNELVPAAYSSDLSDRIGPPPRFRPNDSITWHAFVEETPLLFDDVRESSLVYNEDTAIRSGLYVPLGEHGVLAAVSTEPELYDETTFDLAQLFGATAEAALDRIGRSQRLYERERELKQQNERLERLHRASRLREEIEALLLRADSRREIERGVCERLCEFDGCTLAWIGEPDPSGQEVLPRVTAGTDGGYLEAVAVTAVDDSAAEPAGRAVRTGRPISEEYVAGSIRDGVWRGEALSRDFQSVYAIPLAYDEFLYGVLAVYVNRHHGLDEEIQSVLAELGETVAYTIQAVRRKNTLLGTERTEIELEIEGEAALSPLATALEAAVSLEGVIAQSGRETIAFVSVDRTLDADDLPPLEGVASTTVIGHREGTTIVQLRLSQPFLGSVVDANGGVLRTFVVEEETARAVIDLPRTLEVREMLAAITRDGLSASLVAKRELSRSSDERTLETGGFGRPFEESLLGDLTDQTAYHGGFFEWPRLTTGEELAASLGISPPAFHNHIRAVERKLFDALFDHDRDDGLTD